MAAAADPRSLDAATLVARIEALQTQAFARYERAAALADDEADAEIARRHYAAAEAECAPIVAEARALHEERVRRLRLRVRRWWIASAAVLVAGVAAIAWLMR